MITYRYTAKDKNGSTVIGSLEANSEPEVAELLHNKELVVLSVEQGKAVVVKAAGTGKKVKLDDLVVFSRQLATMIDAGIQLVHALEILSEKIENKDLKDVITTVRRNIEEG